MVSEGERRLIQRAVHQLERINPDNATAEARLAVAEAVSAIGPLANGWNA